MTNAEKIISAISQGAHTPELMIELTGLTSNQVTYALRMMVPTGSIIRRGHGFYTLPAVAVEPVVKKHAFWDLRRFFA